MEKLPREFNTLIIGLGPQGLAVLANAVENPKFAGIVNDGLFAVERNTPGHTWSIDCMYSDTTLQSSTFKDLTFLANPKSEFSFFNFLHKKGKLCSFIVPGDSILTRQLFFEYLQDVAKNLKKHIAQHTEVTKIEEIKDATSNVRAFKVELKNAHYTYYVFVKNIILSSEFGKPVLPAIFDQSDLLKQNFIFHPRGIQKHLLEISKRNNNAPTIIVVGSGQSAGESINIVARIPNAHVISITRSPFFSNKDSNPFINRIFQPEYVDEFFALNENERIERLNFDKREHSKGMNPLLVKEISKLKQLGKIQVKFTSEITNIQKINDETIEITINNKEKIHCNAIISATGYEIERFPKLLKSIRSMRLDDKNSLIINRDYSLKTNSNSAVSVFLIGAATIFSHGLASGELTILPFIANDILTKLKSSNKQPNSLFTIKIVRELKTK